MKTFNRKFYEGTIGISFGFVVFLLLMGKYEVNYGNANLGLVFILLSLIPMLVMGILNAMLLYKAWDSIQDGFARTTPGKAIGLLFIPFFNIYWMFQAVWGLSKDINSFRYRHRLEGEKLPENLFLLIVILTWLIIIPYLGVVLMVINYILWMVMVSHLCDSIILIKEKQQK